MATQDLSAYGLASRIGGRRSLSYFQDFLTRDVIKTDGTGEFQVSWTGTWSQMGQASEAGGALKIWNETTALNSAGVSGLPVYPVNNGLSSQFRFKVYTDNATAGIPNPTAGAIGFRGTDGTMIDPLTTGSATYAVITFVQSTGALTLKTCKTDNTSQSVTLTQTLSTLATDGNTSYIVADLDFNMESDDTVTCKMYYNGALAATITDAIESTAVLAPYFFVKNGIANTVGNAALKLDYVHINCEISR